MENKEVLLIIDEILANAPEKIPEEDIREMIKNGQSIDFASGKNRGIQQFIDNIKKIREKYE